MRPVEQQAKAVIKILNAHESGRSTREKFRDFVELSYCAIAKTMAFDEDTANTLEERYMRIVNSYRDKDAIRAYPEALAITAQMVGYPYYEDFLGRIAGEVGQLSGDMGQFFTPMSVSRMLAQMSVSEDTMRQDIEQQGYITVGEPAAGAGGMVLAMGRTLAELGFDPSTTMLFHATDVSASAYEMCYVQLALAGLAGYVEHGNTLSLEHFRGFWTPNSVTFHAAHGHLSFATREKGQPQPGMENTPSPRTEAPQGETPTVQLSLWDDAS